MIEVAQQTAGDNAPIRPFQMNVPGAELAELRRRITAARWPERQTVTDDSQGVQLATTQKLARYWETDHDHSSVGMISENRRIICSATGRTNNACLAQRHQE
jgi:hypothetical protein